MEPRKYDVFISYRRTAYDTANLIAEKLRHAGIKKSGVRILNLNQVVMRYNRFAILISVIMSCLCIYGQTQQGYVKTKGRLGNNGTVIAGTRLQGATVTVRGGNAVVSGSNGTFSLAIPTSSYYLQSVQKQGYVLTDPDVLSKQYAYSKNPLVLVLETPDQQSDDRLAAERKIRRTLQKQLQDREDEIEALKEQQKLSEEEYRKQLQEIYAQQESNEKLIGEMAERYSRMDFDEVNEFNRRISSLILEGKLTEADSLLNTKGDINSRAAVLRQHQEANVQAEQELKKKQKKLEKSKAMTQKELEDLAQDCYSKFEIFKMQHLNDSASYYIGLRASLDSVNMLWQMDAGKFYYFVADYDKAQALYERVLQSIATTPNQEPVISACYNNLASVSMDKGNYNQAFEYHQKALQMIEKLPDDNARSLAESHYGLGRVYKNMGKYSESLQHFQKSLELMETAGYDQTRIGNVYNAIGVIYLEQDNDLDKALKYFQKARDILKAVNGERNEDVALVNSNIASVYRQQQKYEESIEINKNILDIYHEIYGERHPLIGRIYLNMSVTYRDQKNYAESERYLLSSLDITSGIFGPIHPDVGTAYVNLAGLYGEQGKYELSLMYYQKALVIYEKLLGPSHHYIGLLYLGMGATYNALDEYTKSLESLEKALPILENVLGIQHPYVVETKKDMEELRAKLKN